jgi:hypothetical protein
MSNQQAFPVPAAFISSQGDILESSEGMTLRDYFAAQVACNWCDFNRFVDDDFFEGAADAAYKMADAMLKAREK